MSKILKIFESDQRDRKNPAFWNKRSFFNKRDLARREQVKKIIGGNNLKTGKDFYLAAMIFHHHNTLSSLNLALNLAQKSMNLGFKKAKWLVAAIGDRILIKRRLPQKFGTQYYKKNANSKWELYTTDSKTTDYERKQYNVPTKKQMSQFLEKLNKTK